MGESNIPEDFLPFGSPGVAVNRVLYANPPCDAATPLPCNSPAHLHYFHGRPSKDIVRSEARMEQQSRGATSAVTLHPDGCFLHPAPSGGACGCWNCTSSQRGSTQAANRHSNRHRENDGSICELQNDVEDELEELEAPLPLKDENDWDNYNHFICTSDGRPRGGQLNHDPSNRYFPQTRQHFSVSQQHGRHWDEPQRCVRRHDTFTGDSLAHGAVSVNVPQFSIPPVEGVSHVSVLNLMSARGNDFNSHPQQKRRTISLPEECRKVFITYSSDVSTEILSFVDFLTKHGLRPAIDLLDSPVRSMDINKWNDSNLKDPLTLIIIAVSPKYKADIEGSVADSHALRNKYIHSMMQNEFIKQGSLNFRFIPVLFLGASQKLVPTWLQNTRVYRWPQDTEDLLLRLLREERFVPPPVPVDLTLIITPLTSIATTTP